MAVYHILKDGSRPTDITGHVVKFEDAEPLYRYIHSINLRGSVTGKTLDTYKQEKNEVRL